MENSRIGALEDPVMSQPNCFPAKETKSICQDVEFRGRFAPNCETTVNETLSNAPIEVSQPVDVIAEYKNMEDEIGHLTMKSRATEDELEGVKGSQSKPLIISGLNYQDIVYKMRNLTKEQTKQITHLTIHRALVWKWNNGLLVAKAEESLEWEMEEQAWREFGTQLLQFTGLVELTICFNHYLFDCGWFDSWVNAMNEMSQLKVLGLLIWIDRKEEQQQDNWTTRLNKTIKVNIQYGAKIE